MRQIVSCLFEATCQTAPLSSPYASSNRWSLADGDAESNAERQAILKLLNREWREKDELDMAQAEVDAVNAMKA